MRTPRWCSRAAERWARTSSGSSRRCTSSDPASSPSRSRESIGAITAAVVGGAKGDPIAALDRLWREKLTVSPAVGWLPEQIDRSLALLGNPGMYRLTAEAFTAPWAATSIYDTSPLRRTLAELVDPAKLDNGATRVVVGATKVHTGEMEFFDSHEPGGLTFEHVAASGSLPPSFPMTEIEGDWYLGRRAVLQHAAEPGDPRPGPDGRRPPRRAP
jgi:predicted acylesterase/phospholipase RssA